MSRAAARPPLPRSPARLRRVGAAGALAMVALLAAACTGASGGTQVLRSIGTTGPATAVTGSSGGAGSSVTGSSATTSPSATGGSGSAPSATTRPPSTTSPPDSSAPTSSSAGGLCHDPNDPDVVYDCDSPPPSTFPGDHADWAAAITACMADRGWPDVDLTGGSIAPASGGSASQAFGEAAVDCLHQVGTFDIANASDAEITRAYRQLRSQWTCLKEQKLPVQPFPSLQQVLDQFHRTHQLTVDPLAGLDRDVGLSYCPSPHIPGVGQSPSTVRLGH